MQNIDSEIVKSPKASAFTLIVAFVCVALVGLALIPLLPVKLNPSRTFTRLHGEIQYARYFSTCGGNDGYQ